MSLETLFENDALVIRRMILRPREQGFWHTDSCKRFTVVVRGTKLTIEYREQRDSIEVDVFPGMVGWDDPETEIHRAVNAGSDTYEEVVTFYKLSPDVDPQPSH